MERTQEVMNSDLKFANSAYEAASAPTHCSSY